MTAEIEAAGRRPAGRCWIALRDQGRARTLEDALLAQHWQVDRRFCSVAALGRALASEQPPALLVLGLGFDDGDALQLIRALRGRPDAPALYIVSRQQRAVIKAAVALAQACGLCVVGAAEEPVAATMVAADLSMPRVWPTRHLAAGAVAALGAADLRRLIDRQALQVWAQPQMLLRTREIVGFEALMRGVAEDGAVLKPDDLVPALSAHGLLAEATLMLLDQTARLVAAALQRGQAVTGSVNVSLRSMSDTAFCRELPRILERHGLDPCWITIEITETDAMRELTEVVENTARVRMFGFRLSIDDFGSGYSSLSQLLAIPFSELKLDRSFIQDLDTDPRKQAVVRCCAELGRSLGLEVVAEGVETSAEQHAVETCGCTHVQGYRLAKPMPSGRALDWLGALPNQVWTVPS